MLPSYYSFKLLSKEEVRRVGVKHSSTTKKSESSVNAKKRTFLRLLGLIGLGFIASSFFSKKADALVFGSAPSSSTVGVKDASNARINPATNEKLDDVITALSAAGGYAISDLDESGAVNYFGYVSSSGSWYILSYNTSTNAFRYVKGESAYATNWSNRATLSYDYYDVIF